MRLGAYLALLNSCPLTSGAYLARVIWKTSRKTWISLLVALLPKNLNRAMSEVYLRTFRSLSSVYPPLLSFHFVFLSLSGLSTRLFRTLSTFLLHKLQQCITAPR